MPVTGILNQEEAPVDNSDSQNGPGEVPSTVPPLPPSSEDSCTLENTAEPPEAVQEISATVDPDAKIVELSKSPVSIETTVTAPIQTEQSNWSDDTTHETETQLEAGSATPLPPFSNTSFQSAFAAFASASTVSSEAEAMEVGDVYTSSNTEVATSIPPEESSPLIEQSAAPAIDSGLVSTTQEPLEMGGDFSESQHNAPVTMEQDMEQDSVKTDTTVETTVENVVPVDILPISETQPVEQDSGNTEATVETNIDSTVLAEALPIAETQPMEHDNVNTGTAVETTVDSTVIAEALPIAEAQSNALASSVSGPSLVPEALSAVEVNPIAEMPSIAETPSEVSEHADLQTEFVAQPEAVHSEGHVEATQVNQDQDDIAQPQMEESISNDAVYFIQMADNSGEIITSIIDPNDISSYSDSIVYKQCMGADGQIETTIVNSGSVPVAQVEQQAMEETPEAQPEVEQPVIYAHDLNGHLTSIDSAQSATDVAPPGKQFVYMQDSSGRIIRTIMDANQTMVPGQQVYYTQSEDGRIITSVMDSNGTEDTQQVSQPQQSILEEAGQLPPQTTTDAVAASSAFAMDNSMSGLNMLAELSHLTAGQASAERKGPSSTDSSSHDADMDEFRPVAMITRRVAEDGVEMVKSSLSNLKFAQDAQNAVPQESMVARLVSEIKTETSGPGETVSQDNLFVQWQNLDAMCWMDVVLVMLVYSPTLRPLVNLDQTHELACTLLIKLLKANRQAQILLQNLLKKSSAESSLQTGAGSIAVLPDIKSTKLVCKENMDEIGKAINILYAMREKIWQALQPRLRCERGKHNSPVLVLPLLVREKPIIKQMFTMNYRYVFKCAKCGYSQDDSHSKILPTIPAVPLDFNMKEPCFARNCFECQAPDQRMLMKFEGLQDFVQMHFVKGLPHSRFDELSFDHNGDHYEVTGVVHYKNNPDHFIAWVRNAPSNTWMECDDLKSVITRYQATAPVIPPSQVHMVIWERRLTPEHTLVMRDTEDTKYLSSLVLTVQQPASQATSDASTANQKRLGAPFGSTTSATSLSQAGPATTFLSGLISQSQSTLPFQSYTHRGGRGSRGGRGTRTPRGGITIRRAAPSVTTQMATPRQTSTQIIRLPVSALQGVNSNVRGNIASSPSRYVYVGGNNGQSTQMATASPASKVVVVRSQGGSSSLNNLSAAQLLQLLQRTGALSQANARITTQITRTTGDGTADTQTLMTNVPSTAVPSQTEEVAPVVSSATFSTENQGEEDNKVISSESMSDNLESTTSAVPTETLSATENYSTPTSEQALGTSSVLGNVTVPQETETTAISTPQQNSSASELISVVQEGIKTSFAPSGTIRTLSMNPGEPTRYIQIPNATGGPNIVTQLVMKGGKMILVPVDKNAQAQATSTPSIIRLPGSAVKSSQLNTSTISSPTILQTSTSMLSTAPTTSTVSATLSSPQYITLPGSQVSGNKRTIQLITVPRGTNSTPGQTAAKTFIVSPAGTQTSPRIVTETDSTISSGREAIPQTGNILIRELKRPEDGSSSTVNTVTALPSAVDGETSNASTVSLLRDMNMKSVGKSVSEELTAGSGISLLSSSTATLSSKPQESFKYILPGSSLHQMSAIQNISGPQSGRAFTALSSSGTIIGGHLTPTSGALSVDQSTSMEAVGDGSQTVYTAIKEDEGILRGRGRGRGQRGRGRGVRTRGRGRQQLSDTISITTHPQPKIVKRGGTISMLSADLRQIGGQIIESSNENVDGVPVVSIPDFSSVSAMQTESLSAAESLNDSINPTSSGLSENISPGQQGIVTTASDPLIITQTIPSIKGNHGFDILTQGILGSGGQSAPLTPRKSGISLLTGKTVVPSSFSSTITLEASKTQQSLAMGQSVTQNEIETLIKAAQGASKPPKPGHPSLISSPSDSFSNATAQSTPTISSEGMGFSPNRFIGIPSGENLIEVENNQILTEDIKNETQGENLMDSLTQPSSTGVEEDTTEKEEERVFSVDESQVSAAERYRMPTELFQPDDESPEKPVKSDLLSRQLSGSQILGEDLPSKLFQDSEISSQEDDASLSPQRQPKSPSKCGLGSPHAHIQKAPESYDTATNMDSSHLEDCLVTSRTETDMELEETEELYGESEALPSDLKSPGKRGKRGRGRGRGKGKSGRRKSASTSDTQESPMDASPPPPLAVPISPETGHQLVKADLPRDLMGSTNAPAKPEDEGPAPDVSPQHRHVLEPKDEDVDIDQSATQYNPAVLRTRPKVNWDDGHSFPPPLVFNSQVLTRKCKKKSPRHLSLGPQLTSFTSLPEPFPEPRVKNEKEFHMELQAIVNRRKQKPLERPTVDPSKEPTVIPLVAEKEGDPACTGGSVVTSHIDGEVFTGVIVHQRREMADWSCGLEEDEDEDGLNFGEMLTNEDEVREYLETMWTAMCIEVGDFTLFDHPDYESESDSDEHSSVCNGSADEEEKFDVSKHEGSPEADSRADNVGEDESQEATPQSPVNSKSPLSGKRSASDDLDAASPSGQSPKRLKVAIDDKALSPLKAETDTVSNCSKKVDIAVNSVNGISNSQSVSSHADPASPSVVLPSARPCNKESFVSPARRSSRTPVPSYKIRDYVFDEKPLKSAAKGRRSSVLSSDDDLSGSNSDEVSLKKGKKKNAKTLQAESLPL